MDERHEVAVDSEKWPDLALEAQASHEAKILYFDWVGGEGLKASVSFIPLSADRMKRISDRDWSIEKWLWKIES